ncbi:NUDIX hydrolase [Lysobacter sp. CW239]|jgi:8-oxo-dGTP pyrophosphatase MutT (NUDIX family)|nr:NUDIX hydrolase [Lysobacter sp. CW239]
MAATLFTGSILSDRERRFWQPDVTVATVVVCAGRLLMVEETSQGRLVLNQPAGHLEPDESLLEAALRETREETRWDVRLTAFIGAYQWKAPVADDGRGDRHYMRFAFAAEPVSHDPARDLDTGIVQALWLTPGELQDQAGRHRSPLVWRTVADYLAGRRHPLDLVQQLA